MKKVEYVCDLCKEVKPKEQMLAYYWKSDILPQRYVLQHDLNSCDKHLCKTCFHTIKNTLDTDII